MMRDNDVRCLTVERRGPEDACGIVTQRDGVCAVTAWNRGSEEVELHDIMTRPLVVVNKDLDIRHVARLMANVGLSRAPVILDGELQASSPSATSSQPSERRPAPRDRRRDAPVSRPSPDPAPVGRLSHV
jgi:CBS domain-containing protein